MGSGSRRDVGEAAGAGGGVVRAGPQFGPSEEGDRDAAAEAQGAGAWLEPLEEKKDHAGSAAGEGGGAEEGGGARGLICHHSKTIVPGAGEPRDLHLYIRPRRMEAGDPARGMLHSPRSRAVGRLSGWDGE